MARPDINRESIIVDRDREREQLRAVLNQARSGRGRLVLIQGEAGVGKTTLAEDLMQEARQHDFMVLAGDCYDLTTTPPYDPWREAFRGYRPDGDMPAGPGWIGNPDGLAQIGSQAAIFENVGYLVERIAGTQPLVIVLEDLHWSDPASLDLLRYLGRSTQNVPLLLVATYRDNEIDRDHRLFRLLPLLVREARAVRIELKPLDAAALAELLNVTYGLSPGDQVRLVRRLSDHAEGNPLFTHEILRLLESQGALQQEVTGWTLGDLSALDVPPLIVQLIESRLTSVSAETRVALDIAATIGQQFSFDLWECLVQPDDEMLHVLRESTMAQIIEQANNGQTMRFRHAIFRQAIYERLLIPERRKLHRRVAEALLETADPEPNAVAHHLGQAEDDRAVDWFIRAGGRDERLYAPLMAINAYERAIDRLASQPERDRERGWLLHRVARLYRWHDPQRSLPYLQQAQEISREIGDLTLEAYSRFDTGLLRRFIGDLPGSFQEMIAGVEMIDALPAAEQERSLATISPLFAEAIPDNTQSGYAAVTMPGSVPNVNLRKQTLAWHLASCGRFDEAEASATAIIQELHEVGIERHQLLSHTADAFRALGIVHAVRGRSEEASYHLQLAREAAAMKDDHLWIGASAMLELFLVNLVYEADQSEQRQILEARIEAVFASVPQVRVWLDPPSSDDFQVMFLNGRWTSARRLAQEYLRPVPPRAPLAEQSRAMSILAQLAQRQGRLDEAKQWIARLFPHGPSILPDSPLFFVHERTRRVAIEVALDEGDLDSAACWLDAHETWLDDVGCVIGRPETELLRARLCLLAGDSDSARKQAALAFDRANNPRQPRALLTIDRFLGELELADGNNGRARELTERSLELARRCELPDEVAFSRLAHAEALNASDKLREADVLVNRALSGLIELGARPQIEQANALLTRINAAMKRESHPDGLSSREAEVLQGVARGLTNAQIADELFISPRTVGSHITSIYRKLGVNSRAAATRFAIEFGLVSTADSRHTTSND